MKSLIAKLHPALRISVIALLTSLLLLAGCGPIMGPSWSLTVRNYSDDVDLPTPYLTCEGALTASISVENLIDMTVTATPEQGGAQATTRHEGAVRSGDRVTIEATCTDADSQEVGYTRIEAYVTSPPHTGYGGNTHVRPAPTSEWQHPEFCLTPVEARGDAPCIVERMVAPN